MLSGPCACSRFIQHFLPLSSLFLSLLTPPSHQLWLRSVSDGVTSCSDLVVVLVFFVALCAPRPSPFSLLSAARHSTSGAPSPSGAQTEIDFVFSRSTIIMSSGQRQSWRHRFGDSVWAFVPAFILKPASGDRWGPLCLHIF